MRPFCPRAAYVAPRSLWFAGQILVRYLFGEHDDEILAHQRPGQSTLWYLVDKQGSVRDQAVYNESTGQTQIVNHILYDAFGQILSSDAPLSEIRLAFTGREFDAATGLYYYRARYYDAALGRFISQDPLCMESGDFNLYRYVGNSPLSFADPTGMSTAPEYSVKTSTRGILQVLKNKYGCYIDAVREAAIEAAVSAAVAGAAGAGEAAVELSTELISCAVLPATRKMQGKFLIAAQRVTPRKVQIILKGGRQHLSKFFAAIGCPCDKLRGNKKTWAPTYSQSCSGGKRKHHIIQNAAAKGLPCYSKDDAPVICLSVSQHHKTFKAQRQKGGGTYGAERGIAEKALKATGIGMARIADAMERADDYFSKCVGLSSGSPTNFVKGRRK